MTRKEFIDRFKHELAGFVCDAATAGRQHGELALWLRTTMQRIDAQLGAMWDAMQPAEQPANGTTYRTTDRPRPAAVG